MTIKEIAKIAGVSKGTVSKVINGYSNIPEETKQKIFHIMKENNYVPNRSAQLLAGKTTNVLGIFIVELDRDWDWEDTKLVGASPYYSEIINAAVDITKAMGYLFMVYEVSNSTDIRKVCELFSSGTVSGGIFVGIEESIPEFCKLAAGKYPVVFLDRQREKKYKNNGLYITANNAVGIGMAVKYLVKLGHKKIAHLAGDLNKITAIERKEMFVNAMKENNLEVSENQIVEGKYIEKHGYKAANKLLENYNPSAIVCANDMAAFGAMKAIKEKGLRIPEDISIIGFDNIKESEFSEPPLTTIEYSLFEMTNIAVRHLVDKIESGEGNIQDVLMPVKLIERRSVISTKQQKRIVKRKKLIKNEMIDELIINSVAKEKSSEIAKSLLGILDEKIIAEKTGLLIEEVMELKNIEINQEGEF